MNAIPSNSVGPGRNLETGIRQSQIPAELQQMSEALEALERSVGQLFERLAPVLRMEPAVDACSKRPHEEQMVCQHAASLQLHRSRIERTTTALNDMQRMLEV